MNSLNEKENMISNFIWTSQKDKSEVENSNNQINLKPGKNYEKYGKNFIPKSNFKKSTENKNESKNCDFNIFTTYFEDKKSSSYIFYYYDSTNKYLKNRKDYINLFNNLNHSKNFICTKSNSDSNINNNLDENKSLASASTKKSKTDLDENNNNLYIINNININVNQNTIKNNNNNNKYYSKQNMYKDNLNNDDYLLEFNLLNRTQNLAQINNNIYNNNNYLRKLNCQNLLNLNQTTPSNNTKTNFVNKFNGDSIYPVLKEPNINTPFYTQNFNNQNPNSNINVNISPKNKKISTPENKNSLLNIKSNSSSSDEEINKNKKEQDDYLVKMFGRTGWICILCNNFNYETRYKCNRCGLQKRPKKLLELSNKKELFVKYNKNGDWLCNECQNLNYSFRKVCNRCKAPKPNENKNIMLPFSNNLVNNSLNVNRSLNLFNLPLSGLNL